MSKKHIDMVVRSQWKKRRTKKMIFVCICLIVLFLGIFAALSVVLYNLNKKEAECKYDSWEPEMVSLDDIPDEVVDELTKPTGYVMTSEELKEAMYKQDISESMPEVYEKLVEAETEELNDGYKYLDILLPKELQKFSQDVCNSYDFDYSILLALMESESSFRDDIGSEKVLGGEEGGDRYYGYMQLSWNNCERAKSYALDAHTPEGNIEMAVILMSGYMETYGDVEMAVMCYKCGEGGAKANREKGFMLPAAEKVADRAEYYKILLEEE